MLLGYLMQIQLCRLWSCQCVKVEINSGVKRGKPFVIYGTIIEMKQIGFLRLMMTRELPS